MASASGLTLHELSARFPDLDVASEQIRGFSGVPGAESLDARVARGRRAVRELLQRHSQDDVVLAVAHGGIMQHLIREVLGSDRTWAVDIRNTALFDFSLDVERWSLHGPHRNYRLWRINAFGDASHIEGLGV